MPHSTPAAARIDATWRIPAALVIAQLPGCALGLLIAATGDTFLDLWYGAAFAMPFGFAGGILWQATRDAATLARRRATILAYGLFSAAMPVLGALTHKVWAHVVT